MNIKKIGIIIADDMEYAPFLERIAEFNPVEGKLLSRRCDTFDLKRGDKSVEVVCVHCGIGKVNAAAATAFAISEGVDCVINTGLSGGINRIARNMITLPDRLMEHDFDLTVLGYDFAAKPSQTYIYEADKRLNEAFLASCPKAKVGMMVTGDCFVSDSGLKERLINRFDAMSCDMESAAIASVCHFAGVPFTAVRRVSDDAGENAGEAYTAMNERVEQTLAEIVIDGICVLLDSYIL